MKSRNRWLGAGAIVLLILILVSLVFAPSSANLRHGSTYSRAPSGYGAWYAYMQTQGIDIHRWQRPIEDLPNWNSPGNLPENLPQNLLDNEAVSILDRSSQTGNPNPLSLTQSPTPLSLTQSPTPNPQSPTPITLLQIDNGLNQLTFSQWQWLEQGNVLIQLGRGPAIQALGWNDPVTAAPFTSAVSSLMGNVKIQTSRRLLYSDLTSTPPDFNPQGETADRLSDSYGAIVLQKTVGQGRWMVAVTPHLAANAYQQEPGNFQFLEQLVTESGHPVWVDEYLHGYKDEEIIAEATDQTLLSYFAQTPLPLVAMQAIVILAVLVWGRNRRFGPPVSLPIATRDNSVAYMQAIAAVLQKANCREFVVETISRAEQRQLQRSLGLGDQLLDPATVIEAWVQQTGRSATDLEAVFNPIGRRRLSEQELFVWLKNLQTLRQD